MSKPDPVIGQMHGVDIPEQVARHVLWHFGDYGLGQQPGGFTTDLLRAMSHADSANRARITSAFPEYAHPFYAVANQSWGLEWLRGKVLDAQVTHA